MRLTWQSAGRRGVSPHGSQQITAPIGRGHGCRRTRPGRLRRACAGGGHQPSARQVDHGIVRDRKLRRHQSERRRSDVLLGSRAGHLPEHVDGVAGCQRGHHVDRLAPQPGARVGPANPDRRGPRPRAVGVGLHQPGRVHRLHLRPSQRQPRRHPCHRQGRRRPVADHRQHRRFGRANRGVPGLRHTGPEPGPDRHKRDSVSCLRNRR
ncbi:hypothetical protein SAMN05661093_07250 [Kibdelosporangium aridum]|uniref:Uncharacterized protein n=1 Tax=Kibdelosporangium aridum TaxID=2030 RepID=A0A1W2FK58_KIBAR|nr:hypothetical protein SAMN05661093_07250 [Kibdelosporangium aridum]